MPGKREEGSGEGGEEGGEEGSEEGGGGHMYTCMCTPTEYCTCKSGTCNKRESGRGR